MGWVVVPVVLAFLHLHPSSPFSLSIQFDLTSVFGRCTWLLLLFVGVFLLLACPLPLKHGPNCFGFGPVYV